MTRRDVISSSVAFLPQSGTAAPAPIKPRALRSGDTVGLITPSTMVADPNRLLLAERTLEYFGLKAKRGNNVGRHMNYADSIGARLDDLHAMFSDNSVNAVFAIRGGYGASQLLDRIDYGLIRKNPKILLGYSDITALHLAIQKQCGLVTFHGPVAVSAFTGYTQTAFKRALFDTKPLGPLTNPVPTDTLRPSHTLRPLKGGRGRGALVGGNLALIVATMGTPYEIDTRGKILLLEDVGEQAYSLDRMLTNLRLAGKLDAAAGIVWGECADCGPFDYKPSFATPYTVGEVVDGILGKLKVPVLAGLTFGHTSDQLTIPLGVTATLDADKGELIIEEPAVQA